MRRRRRDGEGYRDIWMMVEYLSLCLSEGNWAIDATGQYTEGDTALLAMMCFCFHQRGNRDKLQDIS